MSTDTMPLLNRREDIIKKLVFSASFLAAGFLLARIQLLSIISPFGPALVSACFLMRRSEALPAAAGVALGALLVPEDTLYVVTVTLLICTGLLFVRCRIRMWMALMATACAYAISAALFKTQNMQTFMTAVLGCLVSLVVIYVLYTTLQILLSHKKRSVFSTEETICLAFGAMVVVCMFGPLSVGGVYIADIIAEVLVLFAACIGGAALGSGIGLGLGLALCLGVSADVTMIGMLGVSGLIAGTLKRLRKPGVSLSFLLTGLLFILAFYSAPIWYLMFIEAVAASVIFILLPGKLFSFAGKYLDIKTRRDYEYRLHTQRVKELTVDRLKEVSEVFAQTGEMFDGNTDGAADISDALSFVAESTCRDCVFRKSCWDKDFTYTYQVFSKLFAVYEKKGSLEATDVDASFVKKCFNVPGILSAAKSTFAEYLLTLRWRKKIEASRVVTGRQLKGVAQVVYDIGQEMDNGFQFLSVMEDKITAALDEAGIHAHEVCAENACGGLVVGLKVTGCKKEHDCRRSIERAVSAACGMRMERINQTICGEQKSCTLRFGQAFRFNAQTGIALAARDDISGDSYTFQSLKDGRYMMMLCDGMGSGEAARRESAATVSLVENFFQAGFDDGVVFDTINRLLLLKSEEEIFSTVDLCMLDLKTGAADFTKIAAEHSYIFTKNRMLTITPGSLPIGILDEVTPASTQLPLSEGDMIVMISDGVSDVIAGAAEEWFSDIPKEDPQETANAILQKALGRSTPADDMTVIVSRLNVGQTV